jgi:hypothetical protein
LLPLDAGSCDGSLAGRCTMSGEQLPSHALFVQWGRFKAGAFGIPAVVALIFFAALVAYLWVR